MQLIVTHGHSAKPRILQLAAWQLIALLMALALLLMALSGLVYHFVFLKAAREGWPVVSQVVRLVVRDEIAQRDRFLRENLDAMARRVGEMQAKLMKLEAVGERTAGMAGLKPEDLRGLDTPVPSAPAASAAAGGGRGGPFVPVASPSIEALDLTLASLDRQADRQSDLWTLIESRLLESRLRALTVPSIAPVEGPIGSGFGFRADPFTGQSALHTGLDFPAEPGTSIMAAAGGMVVTSDRHPAYGLMVEIDHGNGLITRYAHASKLLVKAGDLVRRGQSIAQVGTSGRSTGPHLHFEVLVEGVPQDPAKFLAQGSEALNTAATKRSRPKAAAKPATESAAKPAAENGAETAQ